MRWLIIQTNLAQCPYEPMFKEVELETLEELTEQIEDEERNDMNITAVPVTKLLIAMGIIEPDETQTVEQ